MQALFENWITIGNGAFCLKRKDQSNFSIAIPDFLLNYENYNGSEKPKLSQSLAKNILVEVQHLMGLHM